MELWGVLTSGVLVSWWVLSVNGVGLPVPPCAFPAIYNFGDSNSDTGGISAAFEPIRAPYGVPYFHKPSGRDCDGRLIDFIAEWVKLPYLHAYLNSLGANFRHGANFATGGSTIRRPNETIYQYGISPFSLDIRLCNLNSSKQGAAEMYKQAKYPSEKDKLPRSEDFAKALYTFDIGQNDLLLDPLKPCCGYHVNYDHVWCGNKAIVNKTEVFGASCKNPSAFVSWDGVHYSQVANQYVADRTLNGSLSDPAIPITQACQKQ
ncbi:GDSL esterase/lipase [Hibiscus syriacus]|uniref:GDSL esterase/lipase n=1 Tax=Hibiscus syriacus TaxID=106335 RepID=A0A6A2ZD78_HIBSY|nr:GDSL esterase/lipase [Hibiscus syriacus]